MRGREREGEELMEAVEKKSRSARSLNKCTLDGPIQIHVHAYTTIQKEKQEKKTMSRRDLTSIITKKKTKKNTHTKKRSYGIARPLSSNMISSSPLLASPLNRLFTTEKKEKIQVRHYDFQHVADKKKEVERAKTKKKHLFFFK